MGCIEISRVLPEQRAINSQTTVMRLDPHLSLQALPCAALSVQLWGIGHPPASNACQNKLLGSGKYPCNDRVVQLLVFPYTRGKCLPNEEIQSYLGFCLYLNQLCTFLHSICACFSFKGVWGCLVLWSALNTANKRNVEFRLWKDL